MIPTHINSKKVIFSFVLILFTLSCTGSASSIILDDSKGYPYDIYDGCYMNNGEYDAYDNMYYLWINGVQFSGTRSTLEDSGREAVCGAQSMSGLNVVRKVFVPTTENWARYLEILSNPTVSPITVNVRVGGNLGSDGDTQIIQTSNGDTSLDIIDRWVVTDDGCDGCWDPSLAHVFDGEGASKKIDTLLLSGYSNDDLYYEWQNVVVQPGGTVIIMHFAVQQTNNANAIADANAIKAPKPEVTISGMDETEINSVVNWALATFTFKKLAPPEALAGQGILYNLTYFNDFDYNIRNLTIYDILPSNITFISNSCGGSLEDGTFIADIGNVSNNSGGYCEINATVKANVAQGSVIINTANISYVNSTGGAVNVTRTNQTLIPNPELDFKSTSTCAVSVEDVVNYTISYRNTGISTARNTSIKNYLPSGIGYVSDNGDGSYSSGVVTFVLGDVLSGASKNITITARATNSADVLSLNNVSLYYENDTGTPFEWYSETSTSIGNFDLRSFDIVVDTEGSTPYSTIHEGINNASSGDSIFVCPGTYYETVNVDRSVNLVGAGADLSMVDANAINDYVFDIYADNVNVSNFTITGSNYDGLRINSNFVNIYENTITNNQGNGIYLYYSSNSNLINNTVSSNSEGIYLYNSWNNILSGINATGNNDAGIYSYYSSNNIIKNINASNNQYGMYIYYQSNGNIISEINASNNNYYGLYSYYSQNNNFTGFIADNNDQGLYFASSNNNIIADNSIGMNNYGITLSNSNSNNINNNFVAGNSNLDFNVYGSVNSGENNTCDKPDGWNDNGVTGCSHLSRDKSTYPDLEVTGISWSPTNFNITDYVEFNVTVKNLGPGDFSGELNLGLYIDGDLISTTSEISNLNTDQEQNFIISWYCNKGGSDRTVTAKADYNNYWAEFNETNNELSVDLPYIAGPDLVVTDITWSPTNFNAGDTVTFIANITNIGDSHTGDNYENIGLYIDGNYVNSAYYNSYSYVNLAPGMNITISSTWTAKIGNHYVTAKVDDPYCCGNYIIETNETNNDLTVMLPRVPGPDLVVTDITWSPSNFNNGDPVTFIANITNIGDSHTGNKYENIGLYIDGNYINYAYYNSYSYVNLTPGMNITISSTWIAQPGNHYVTAKVDDPYCCGNYILETNETNNDLSVALPYVPGPDLVITNITWSPTSYNAGDTLTFFANITNIGDSYTGNNYEYVGFYIDGIYNNYGYAIVNLTPGMNITMSSTWTAQGGNHSITAKVDDPYCCGNNIRELNETNNAYTVDLPGIDLPDLVITNLTWTPFDYSAGNSIILNATVENNGSGSWSGPVRIDFYYKNTTYITSTSPSMSLSAGGVKYATITWSPAQAGDFYFRAQVDRYNSIQESNESNNDYYRRSNASLPDLTVDNINLKVEHKLIPRADQNDNIFWKYNTTTPESGWQNLSYDDSKWSTGKAPIGNTGSYRTNLNLAGGSGYFGVRPFERTIS